MEVSAEDGLKSVGRDINRVLGCVLKDFFVNG